jgi:hypothetical protein
VKIYAGGGSVLAIYKAQFEGEALWMLMAFKFGVPQGRYPFSLKENFILRNDQANSSTRLASTHNYWTMNKIWRFHMGKKKSRIFQNIVYFCHNFFC